LERSLVVRAYKDIEASFFGSADEFTVPDLMPA